MATTAAVLGAANARTAAGRLDRFDEVVVLEPSVEELERLVGELGDPRFAYLLGALPVLPLPDGTVDAVIGTDPEDPEIRRVLREGGRIESV